MTPPIRLAAKGIATLFFITSFCLLSEATFAEDLVLNTAKPAVYLDSDESYDNLLFNAQSSAQTPLQLTLGAEGCLDIQKTRLSDGVVAAITIEPFDENVTFDTQLNLGELSGEGRLNLTMTGGIFPTDSYQLFRQIVQIKSFASPEKTVFWANVQSGAVLQVGVAPFDSDAGFQRFYASFLDRHEQKHPALLYLSDNVILTPQTHITLGESQLDHDANLVVGAEGLLVFESGMIRGLTGEESVLFREGSEILVNLSDISRAADSIVVFENLGSVKGLENVLVTVAGENAPLGYLRQNVLGEWGVTTSPRVFKGALSQVAQAASDSLDDQTLPGNAFKVPLLLDTGDAVQADIEALAAVGEGSGEVFRLMSVARELGEKMRQHAYSVASQPAYWVAMISERGQARDLGGFQTTKWDDTGFVLGARQKVGPATISGMLEYHSVDSRFESDRSSRRFEASSDMLAAGVSLFLPQTSDEVSGWYADMSFAHSEETSGGWFAQERVGAQEVGRGVISLSGGHQIDLSAFAPGTSVAMGLRAVYLKTDDYVVEERGNTLLSIAGDKRFLVSAECSFDWSLDYQVGPYRMLSLLDMGTYLYMGQRHRDIDVTFRSLNGAHVGKGALPVTDFDRGGLKGSWQIAVNDEKTALTLVLSGVLGTDSTRTGAAQVNVMRYF